MRASSDVGSSAVHSYKDRTANLGIYAGYNYIRLGGFTWGPEVSLTAVSTEGMRKDAAMGGSQFDGGFLFMLRVRVGCTMGKTFLYGIAAWAFRTRWRSRQHRNFGIAVLWAGCGVCNGQR